MAKSKSKGRVKLPASYMGGEVSYKLTTEQTYWPKPPKGKKGTKPTVSQKPMDVKVVNTVKTQTPGRKKGR